MHGRVFVQRPVRPNAIIVAYIGAQHAPQVPLANDNDVVQAFAANGPNQSFSKTVLPRRPRRDWLVPPICLWPRRALARIPSRWLI